MNIVRSPADECTRLLNNGWNLVIFQNALRSYTAVALKRGGLAMNWIKERYDETKSICPVCGITADTPALRALHHAVHRKQSTTCGLHEVPFASYPAIASVMEDFAAKRVAEALAVKRRGVGRELARQAKPEKRRKDRNEQNRQS